MENTYRYAVHEIKNYGKLANLHIENEDGQKQIQSGFICDSFKVAKVSNLKMSWWGWKKALAEKYSLSDRTLAMLEEEYTVDIFTIQTVTKNRTDRARPLW